MAEPTKADDYTTSDGPPNVGQLNNVLKHFGDEAKIQVQVIAPNFTVLPLELTVVALAEDGNGDFVVAVFPGSKEEWARSGDPL